MDAHENQFALLHHVFQEIASQLLSKLMYLNQLANHSLESIEEVIHNLNPSVISRLGLVKTLEKIIIKVNVPGKTQFSIDARNLTYKISQGMEVILYRICTELINNALKHSGAKKAWFTLYDIKKEIHLRYEDDGIGFQDEGSFLDDDKTGLNNIYNRVESVGGICRINSEANKGVNIEISFDLN